MFHGIMYDAMYNLCGLAKFRLFLSSFSIVIAIILGIRANHFLQFDAIPRRIIGILVIWISIFASIFFIYHFYLLISFCF